MNVNYVDACYCVSPDCREKGCALRRNNHNIHTTSTSTFIADKDNLVLPTVEELLGEVESNTELNAVLVVVEFLLQRGKTPEELIKRLVEPDTY